MSDKLIRVFDFDNTIYNGNVTDDFIWYARMQCKTKLVDRLSIRLICLRHTFGSFTREQFLELIFKHLHLESNELANLVNEFWKAHRKFIRPFFWKLRHKGDIIVSASPDFIIQPFTDSIKAQLVASKFDTQKGLFIGKPCYGEEKVRRLVELGVDKPDEFYTDSMIDAPLIKYSKKAFLVNNNDVKLVWTKS